MTKRPTLSVIIPTYNSSKYIKRCIDSIINQTYSDLEVIIVDDGSTDGTSEICDEYAKNTPNITVIHQPNSGQSVARNKGLEVASSEFITFVDSDDYIAPDMYERMMPHLQSVNSDIVICDSRRVSENEVFEPQIDIRNAVFLTNDDLWQMIFEKLNNAVWNKIYRKSILENQRFQLDLAHGEDLIFNLEYIRKCSGGIFIDSQLYNYVQRSGSVTASRFSEAKLGEIKSKDRAFKIISSYHPQLLGTAKQYCLRARLNVLRAIYKAKVTQEYSDTISDIKKYLNTYIKDYWNNLTVKDKAEYLLFENFTPLYKIIVHKL